MLGQEVTSWLYKGLTLLIATFLFTSCSRIQDANQDAQTPNQVAVNEAIVPMGSSPTAIIDNGVVQLGVWSEGHLNVPGGAPSLGGTTYVGLRYLPTGAEATAPGCLCEGWGVADAISGVAGYANESTDFGAVNLTPVSMDVTASTAVSVVEVGSTLRVTHDYHPSTTPNLYEVLVTIENISAEVIDVRYRRVMDWDIEPTAFSEFVTLQGTPENLDFSSDDGFASANPLFGPSSIAFTGEAVDSGPADHGALFDFNFGLLDPGASLTFKTFYGAAGTEVEANAALGAVGAELYSYGQPSTADGPTLGTPNTFIFAFAGVGGDPVIPPPTEPGEEGCSPGFWRNRGVTVGAWAEAGYDTTSSIDSVLDMSSFSDLGSRTLLGALAFRGGPRSTGAAEILLRAAIASLLNAAHPNVGYPLGTSAVVADVDAALQQQAGEGERDWRSRMLDLATILDNYNNLGCPLSN